MKIITNKKRMTPAAKIAAEVISKSFFRKPGGFLFLFHNRIPRSLPFSPAPL